MAETPLAALHADLPDATTLASSSSKSALVDGVKDIAFGSVAGMVSKVFEHPFDLCKVRLQSQVLDHTARFNGPIDCLTQTWRNEGIRGLYRGLPAPIVGAMVENAVLFLSYGQIQRAFRFSSGKDASSDVSIAQKVVAGAGAGAITSFFLTPIELVKCKMQVQMLSIGSLTDASAQARMSALPGPIKVFKNVLHTNGVRGLWLGQTGTLLRETGGCAAWFGTKEAICDFLLARRRHQLPEGARLELKEWESAVAGACAGVSYNVVLFPADSVKSALQTEEELRPTSGGTRRTFWGMARAMYASQGVRGLYAGMGITVARAIPSSAMIFLIYDGLSKRFS
ncbi:putative mitochondrial amino acid transporter ARG-13 [Schizopora paradoxa]|uniref:Putative mitochondrial amino acid transporter ARG-13 n=1 Tax=Schizopora paradoxa TaxID=27342 RepID=A0A0H2RGA2_9AGAM|nr:putative mitochondrial amino acid transporter ARG-13 [Schizopora paradoxa]